MSRRRLVRPGPLEYRRALSEVRSLVADEVLSIPQGEPFPHERFTEAISFACGVSEPSASRAMDP
ncbi:MULTISPECIES: hypothetical protein [Nonomuraea]|uniref:GntR family transcriptional regulator n=1 Tax=Nonomuraea mangrovi TaxID=2316207 RepID=A0ABW4T427_9ACTN